MIKAFSALKIIARIVESRPGSAKSRTPATLEMGRALCFKNYLSCAPLRITWAFTLLSGTISARA